MDYMDRAMMFLGFMAVIITCTPNPTYRKLAIIFAVIIVLVNCLRPILGWPE